jgi:hypothetical protein
MARFTGNTPKRRFITVIERVAKPYVTADLGVPFCQEDGADRHSLYLAAALDLQARGYCPWSSTGRDGMPKELLIMKRTDVLLHCFIGELALPVGLDPSRSPFYLV